MYDSANEPQFAIAAVAGDTSHWISGIGIEGDMHGGDLDVHLVSEGLHVNDLEQVAHDAMTHHFSYAAGAKEGHQEWVVKHVDQYVEQYPYPGSNGGS